MAAPVGGEWRVVLVDGRRHIVDGSGVAVATFAEGVGTSAAEYLVNRANAGRETVDQESAIKDAAYADAYKAAAHLLQVRITEVGAALAELRALAAAWAEGRDGLMVSARPR